MLTSLIALCVKICLQSLKTKCVYNVCRAALVTDNEWFDLQVCLQTLKTHLSTGCVEAKVFPTIGNAIVTEEVISHHNMSTGSVESWSTRAVDSF